MSVERTVAPTLRRTLGVLDGALLTIGAVLGTGIFLTAGDVARAVPDPTLVLAVWALGGALTLAGALTYGELGVLYPLAGGLYHYLREAWGPVWGFLYGWTCLLVIMTGGIAAIAVGFGTYLGSFVPAFASERLWWSVALGPVAWSVHGPQVAAVLAIAALTALHHFGVREGASFQNVITAVKLAAVAALIGLGLDAPVVAPAVVPHAMPPLVLLPALLTAMIAALWTYDGWYALTASAGEMKRPERDLPLALAVGVGVVMALYLALNAVYLRALTPVELAASPRAAEAAAAMLLGAHAGRLVSLAVVVSSFGCLTATILYSSRIYQPIAEDGLFPARIARIHSRWRTPVVSLWVQSAWAAALALTGSYTQLFTYVTFGGVLFHVLAGLAVFRLRVTRPEAPRPYRVWGWPVVPALFVLGMLALTFNTLWAAPRESLLGLLAIVLGLPLYVARRRAGHGAPRVSGSPR